MHVIIQKPIKLKKNIDAKFQNLNTIMLKKTVYIIYFVHQQVPIPVHQYPLSYVCWFNYYFVFTGIDISNYPWYCGISSIYKLDERALL